MSLSDLAALAGLISSVAVVVTLAFLLLQMRQTERNQRALMQQGRANRVSDTTLRLLEPDMADVFHRGMNGDESLSLLELNRFLNICRAGFLSGEDSLLQYRTGALDDVAFNSFVRGVHSFLAAPGLRAAWRMSAHQFGDEYRAFMDKMMRETEIAPPADLPARWKAELSAEKTS